MNLNKGKKLTNEQYDLKLFKSNSSYIRIDNYLNTNTKITHKCKVCNKLHNRSPKYILKQKEKPCCIKNKRKDFNTNLDSYKSKLNDNIIIKGEYKNAHTKIEHVCNKCNTEFIDSPKNVLRLKYNCKTCYEKEIESNYLNHLKKVNIELIESYRNSKYPTKHKCLKCYNIWITKPNYIKDMNTGCPNCSSSKGEKRISELLNNLNIKYKREHVFKDLKGLNNVNLRFDFFLYENNTVIEYDGVQHFKPIEYFGGEDYYNYLNELDNLKNSYCLDNKINIIRIPYFDYDKIEEIIYNI